MDEDDACGKPKDGVNQTKTMRCMKMMESMAWMKEMKAEELEDGVDQTEVSETVTNLRYDQQKPSGNVRNIRQP